MGTVDRGDRLEARPAGGALLEALEPAAQLRLMQRRQHHRH
jgi:hypothetical protein